MEVNHSILQGIFHRHPLELEYNEVMRWLSHSQQRLRTSRSAGQVCNKLGFSPEKQGEFSTRTFSNGMSHN